MNNLEEKIEALKVAALAYELALNYDYVPNFDVEINNEFFREYIHNYSMAMTKDACNYEGYRPDEVVNVIIKLINKLPELEE